MVLSSVTVVKPVTTVNSLQVSSQDVTVIVVVLAIWVSVKTIVEYGHSIKVSVVT